MATIREKQPGVWEIRVFTGRDERGRPTQTSRTVRGTKRDAQRKAAELTMRAPTSAAGRTVADALDAWVAANTATWSASSKRDQASRAKLVKADRIAEIKLARLSVAEVERWHARLRDAGVGEASIRNRHQALRAALTQAVRWGWVSSNVAASARLSQPRRKPRAGMSPEDVRSVLAAAASFDPAAELALRLAAVTGARRAELAALRWDDLQGNRLVIDGAVEVVRNEDGPPSLVDAAAKTANQRTVALDSATVKKIGALARDRAEFTPWMFSTDDEPANPDRIGWWWRRARELSGIDQSWRLHDLRHWSATVGISRGHDVRTVAARLGHANPDMTLRVYAHVVAAADEAMGATLGDVLAGEDE
jgi:integrase